MAQISEVEDVSDHDEGQTTEQKERITPQNVHTGVNRRRRFLVILVSLAFIWLTKRVLSPRLTKPDVIYADRYSDEFKYRPAASPIITETLKDGRTLIRGAEHSTRAANAVPEPTTKTKKARKSRRSKKKARKGSRK